MQSNLVEEVNGKPTLMNGKVDEEIEQFHVTGNESKYQNVRWVINSVTITVIWKKLGL